MISVPHGGDEIPSEVMNSINISQKDVFYDCDTLALSLFDFKDTVTAFVTMPIARAILDVNRAPDDLPPDNPDGIIKTSTLQGKLVYKKGKFPEDNIINVLLKKYYFSYHDKITSLLKQHDIKLALDCHTMLEYAPPIDSNSGQTRPLVCLSNDGDEKGKPLEKGALITCPPEWIQTLARSFRHVFTEGKVAINNPFNGGHISRYHYRNTGVPWIQIELNRKLYLSNCYFDAKHLYIKETRIKELKEKILFAIKHFWSMII
ncbi:MAG: N-formylglutamate amidohydrolase [bacterium]